MWLENLPFMCDRVLVKINAKQKHLGCKKCEANQKQHASIQYFIVYFSRLALSLGHLYNNFDTKRWPSDKANHEKYTIKHCMSQGASNKEKSLTRFKIFGIYRDLQIFEGLQ